MQTLVYIIGGYCLIKAVFYEISIINAVWDGVKGDDLNWEAILKVAGTSALLFLTAIEAFNQ